MTKTLHPPRSRPEAMLDSGAEVPRIYCILGMHRSGTSVTARLANLLGVNLGPDQHLLGASGDNPKGFWESEPILRVNEALLARFGGDWKDVPDLPPGWEHAPELADLRERARTLLAEEFGGRPTWGWKEPRTCLTLPFWQSLLPPMHYIISLRDPLDVARSIQRRNREPLERGLQLWLEYTVAIRRHTEGQPRIFLIYEDMFEHWRRDLRRLAIFLGVPELADDPTIQAEVEGFIDQDLWHNRTSRGRGGALWRWMSRARQKLPARFRPRIDDSDPAALGVKPALLESIGSLFTELKQVARLEALRIEADARARRIDELTQIARALLQRAGADSPAGD